ncbi:hypothetical protein A2961_03080 [Candidatus Woesebacteria bacterium RIFCSPLOWO2_01_FULL_39_21]|uniref:Glycosyltransferase RgtA/B/C/D-like domain-containing protein n=1 Tax=Candidatus Woesebacteria bacterium RIFCSPLOWO2_01_FULL_39_21 TaxID=1802519 RepID=A0A1F8BH93_9BACT|nr:MAG: hypothetical protein A2691_02530 [Candidatus Woesebacteria bacterium RIFCSPHIGHO2_01_FULL_39_23]OGM63421.1 MAG: hypothetical protein A2961_03080 [Candidatus Woesebacteria bacterium RIFCSPLOWO2_01_FULL_39_21]
MGKLLIFLISTRLVLFVSLFFINGEFVISTLGERWDGNSYRFIAENGYVPQNLVGSEFIVFLPLFPTILRFFSFLGLQTETIAFFVSNIFFILGSLILYKLLKIDYEEKFSKEVVILISLFPTSYFFSAGYPESLFLFLTAVSFYFARKSNFLLGFLFAGLASITRPTGIFIFPAILYLLLKTKNISKLIYVLPGLIFPIYYLYLNFKLNQDPFSFSLFLKNYWQKSFALPWEGITKSFKLMTHFDWDTYQRVTAGLFEGLSSFLAWIFSLLTLFKRSNINFAYFIFMFLSTLLFTSTGFILSAPRYILSMFPFLIILQLLLKYKLFKVVWVLLSSILLIFYTNAFYLGRWAF